MGIWFTLVTFIGVVFVVSCEGKSPKRPAIDDSTGDNDDGDVDNYPTCGVNEVYDICPRLCPARRCDVDERIIRCGENPKPGDPKCKPGCRCADNYYRNNDGDCVTKDDCPKCFQKNEVYACRRSVPQTCETIDEENGPIIQNKHCKRECRCKDGFYRNKIGECISRKNCLKCNGPHEYFSCGSACDNVCDTIHLQNQTNCPIINIKCNPKCYCEFGYARDHNNICVPIAECPPKCNRPNEVYECQNSCPQTCETIGKKCLSKHISKRDCKRECRCKKGYYRNKLGDCISKKNCLKCSGPHEFFSCGGACDNVCSTLHLQNQTNCPIVNIVCNKMCYCEKGYARDENNICVPIADCPPICGVNEVYDICPRTCPPRRCDAVNQIFHCPRNLEPGDPNCKPGCRCADNYYKNNDGVCVTKNQCPKCTRKNEVYACRSSNPQTCETIDEDYGPIRNSKHCKRECRCKAGYYKNKIGECISKKNCLKCNGPHEYYTCGSACDNVCATLHLQNQTNCPIINKSCNKKCYCEEGYARDENNICVPIADCPPICGVNEVYDICPRICPPRRCDVDERIIRCGENPEPGDPKCKPGCRCADNYYRNNDGVCVTKKECSKCRKKNEVYACRSSNPQTCETIDEDYGPIRNSKHCKRECRCKAGYYKNKIGECISKKNCLKCNGPHEYYTCGSGCDNVCGTLHLQNQTNCPPTKKTCNTKCYCEEGYARDEYNICVPIADCPPPEPTCGINEEPSDCANGGCRRWSCSDEGLICYDMTEESCIKGCVCIDSYVRDDNGICIPKDQCPPVTCGVNEVYDICPALCPPRSCDVDDRTIDCAPNPEPGDPECNPGCRCEDNYYRNDLGVCVTREECPLLIECGTNEIASRCANGGCRKLSCDVPEIVCAKIPIGGCQEGCICKENYLRADNGTCILESECPPVCGLHEVYDECPPTCPPQRCDVDNRLIRCKRAPKPGDPECKPGCRCEDNYYRNSLGECVTREECPPLIKCGTNEIASSCSNGGCQKRSCARPQVVCVKLPPGACKEGCICKENYLRASNGTCILESECPPVCGLHEVYDECPPTCPPQRCDVDNRLIKCKRTPTPGDPECKPGCRCEDDFYRNDMGVCVTRDECPPLIQCGENEYPSSCANGGCRKVSCAIPQIRCVKLKEGGCKEGCLCKDKYLRADNGTCIPEEDCPPVCGINEVYDNCPPICPQQRCDVDAALILCKPNPKPGDPECNPGCRCADNFFKNDEGVCVPRDECPPLIQCEENEYPSSCANGGCRKISCARPQIRCVKLKEGGCKEGCLCKDKYLRADNGTCIPEEDCPPVCGINEIYDICPPKCPQQRCDVDAALILCKPNPKPGDPECNPGCRCADNFLKNDEGVCVPRDECPPIDCGPNEEYSTCANGGCRRYSCNMTAILCVDLVEGGCRPGCICKDTYTRSDDGICIPENECPKRCGPNEEYGCDNTCTKTCNTVDGKCVPPIKSKICKLQCHCKDGYKRNKKGKCVTECDGVTENTTDGLTAFEQGNIDFTEQFLITAAKKNPGESIIGSPFSVLFLLAQLALYATGQAKIQLLNLLHLSNDCEIRTTVPKYFKLISETNNASFDLAQKIYGDDKYPFSKNFKKDSREVFNAEAQNVNFAKPKEAADIINEWVAKQTHNLINNLVSPDSLSADTRLVLAIAIYFKGDWKHQFKARNTKSLPFYPGKTNDEVQVKMMNQVGTFKYAEIDGVQVLQMPYTVPDISFVACLPKSKTGVTKLIKKLKKTSFIKRTLSELKSTTVDVSIPTLDISTTTDLKQVLSDAGVEAIFDPSTAGLSGILETPEDIFVTSAIQKAKLLLNETGTQAAAATAVVVGVRSLPIVQLDPVRFNADHPFIYYIALKKIVVFAGVYAGPQ